MTVSSKPYFIPFKLEHLNEFVNRDTGISDNTTMAEALGFHTSPSYTVVCDDKVLGCGGIILMGAGYGAAWMSLSKDIENHGMWFARAVSKVFKDVVRSCKLTQIEAFIVTSNVKNQMWASFLGFKKQDEHTRYTYVKR